MWFRSVQPAEESIVFLLSWFVCSTHLLDQLNVLLMANMKIVKNLNKENPRKLNSFRKLLFKKHGSRFSIGFQLCRSLTTRSVGPGGHRAARRARRRSTASLGAAWIRAVRLPAAGVFQAARRDGAPHLRARKCEPPLLRCCSLGP